MRADRLLSILLLLQTKGKVTAKELARRLEVSERTIYRDLDALTAAGVPVYAEPGPGGGCALLEGYQTKLTGFTENEVQALSMFNVPGALADLGANKALETALLELSAALPAMHRHNAERVRKRIHLDDSRWFHPKEAVPFLPVLQEAVWHDRVVEIIYRKDCGEIKTYRLHPYGLVAKNEIWYTVAKSENGMRVFRVSRVQSAHLWDETFERPDSFDLPTYWNAWTAAFQASLETFTVTLRVSPEAADALPRMMGDWVHQNLRDAETARDGWKRLELPFDSRSYVTNILLGLGGSIEVLEPLWLRDKLLETAQEVLERYGFSLRVLEGAA